MEFSGALAHINKCCKSYFPTTQIAYDYGFRYINSEEIVPRLDTSAASVSISKWSSSILQKLVHP